MPNSGFRDAQVIFSSGNVRHVQGGLRRPIRGRVTGAPWVALAHELTSPDDMDLAEQVPYTGAFILFNRDPTECAWATILDQEGPLAIVNNVQRNSKFVPTQEHMQKFNDLIASWKYKPETYTGVFKKLFNFRVPSDPIGGIFFSHLPEPDNTLVISVTWKHFIKILPLLEYVLKVEVNRRALFLAMSNKCWYDNILKGLCSPEDDNELTPDTASLEVSPEPSSDDVRGRCKAKSTGDLSRPQSTLTRPRSVSK